MLKDLAYVLQTSYQVTVELLAHCSCYIYAYYQGLIFTFDWVLLQVKRKYEILI